MMVANRFYNFIIVSVRIGWHYTVRESFYLFNCIILDS